MAKTIYSQGDKVEYGIKIYVVDTEEDRQNLTIRSAKMGSKCYVIGTKKWYILNGSFEWDPFVDAGGSGGSGSPFVPKGSVATVNDLPTEGNEIGDLYIVRADHGEWVWLTSEEEPNGYWEQLGSAILPSDIIETTEQMTAAQAAEIRENLGAEPEKFVVTVTEDDVTGDLVANKTFEEILASHQEGKTIEVIFNYFTVLSLSSIEGEIGVGGIANFGASMASGPSSQQLILVIVEYDGQSDNWYYHSVMIAKASKRLLVFGSTPTITPADNTIYNCGELTSLTISNPPATGKYSIVFFSGATATTTVGIENFAAEANKRYRIDVEDNYATYDSWPYTPTP